MRSPETVLVVDDQSDLLRHIKLTLEGAGYRVLTADGGLKALKILAAEHVDLILADIAMPQLNGYQLYERVREESAWVRIPFLFLTARALDSDIRYGKALGVDDYLTKPIQPEDLLSAVEGRLLRARQLAESRAQAAHSQTGGAEVLDFGALRIAPHQYQVWQHDEKVQLSAREFRLLAYLARRPDQVVPHPDLIKATHNLETDYGEAGTLLRPLIRSLRRKLGYRAGDPGCIRNVRGVGYRFHLPSG